MNFGVEFRKCNILHFPTYGHPWDRLVIVCMRNCSSLHFQYITGNFVEFEGKKVKGYLGLVH